MIASRRIRWACDVCGRPARGPDAYVCVDVRRAFEVWREHDRLDAEWEAEWRAAHPQGGLKTRSISDFDVYPDLVPWEVVHRACDPNPERDDYWFSLDRCDTEARLLAWTAHLVDKTWLVWTDWAGLLRRALTFEGSLL